MKTIAVINQKGGVAKSTTAQVLGSLLADGARVLLVDSDAQGNLTYSLGVDSAQGGGSLYDVLTGAARASDCIRHISRGLDLISSSPSLAAADLVLKDTGKEYRLKEAVAPTYGFNYDYCIIDTPPSLGILTINALTAADGVVIPAQADAFSLLGISQVRDTIGAVQKYCNPALRVYGILLTRFQERTIISRNVSDYLHSLTESEGLRVFATHIRECTAVKEAQVKRTPLTGYAPACNAAKDYASFLQELKEVMA